tara:strand:+ start:1550 stop:1702 length:153 start_codon:yes stop_codon:yes gene_type:complete
MNLGALIVLFKLFQESGVSPPPDSDPCKDMKPGSPAWLACKEQNWQKGIK